jgi:hypothetical protein
MMFVYITMNAKEYFEQRVNEQPYNVYVLMSDPKEGKRLEHSPLR